MKTEEKRRAAFPLRAFILFVAVSAAIVASFLLWGDALEGFAKSALARADGDPAIAAAVLFLILASDIVLPIPSSLASVSCGLLLGPWLGFAVSFAAMSASSAAGYAIGRTCANAAARFIGPADMAALDAFQRRFGVWALLALRPVPVLAEASTIMAGVARQPLAQTALLLTLGNATVSLVYALAGAFLQNFDAAALWAFIAVIAVSVACIAVKAVPAA